MANTTRRRLVLAIASVGALIASAFYESPSIAEKFVPTDIDNAKKPYVPFSFAKSLVDDIVKSEFEKSEKDFGITYSPADRDRIKDRLWEKTQLAMLEFYNPKEPP